VDVSGEIEQLAKHFRDSPVIFRTSPLYQALCPVVAGDRQVLTLLMERRRGQEASYLFFGAVHYLLLSGVPHPLRAFYSSLTAGAVASPDLAGPALLDFCRAHESELRELIRTRLVQTNVVKRASGLRAVLCAVKRWHDRPVHLVEIGASAGVHLHFDRYRYAIGDRLFGPPSSPVTIVTQWRGTGPPPDLADPPPIASRVGVDLDPVNAADPRERLWLRALVWPESQEEADLLTAALASVAPDPPVVIAGDAIDVCPALGESLPAGEPRVVFHAATRMHVPPERRAAFDDAIDSVGRHGPLYHAWQEPPSAQHWGAPAAELGALFMHGPADHTPVPLFLADGHLDWMAPLPAQDGDHPVSRALAPPW
jgi:hypothetical protein